MTLPHPHWTRIPETASPLRCTVTVGWEQVSSERDCSAEAAINDWNAGVEAACGRTFKLNEAKADSLDEEPGSTRGTNWSDVVEVWAIMFWFAGRLAARSPGG